VVTALSELKRSKQDIAITVSARETTSKITDPFFTTEKVPKLTRLFFTQSMCVGTGKSTYKGLNYSVTNTII